MCDKTCGTCRHMRPMSDDCECSEHPEARDHGTWMTWSLGQACENHAESNWHRWFGTPEKAAEMLGKVASCGRDCPLFPVCTYEKKCEDVWLEWLEGDAE